MFDKRYLRRLFSVHWIGLPRSIYPGFEATIFPPLSPLTKHPSNGHVRGTPDLTDCTVPCVFKRRFTGQGKPGRFPLNVSFRHRKRSQSGMRNACAVPPRSHPSRINNHPSRYKNIITPNLDPLPLMCMPLSRTNAYLHSRNQIGTESRQTIQRTRKFPQNTSRT